MFRKNIRGVVGAIEIVLIAVVLAVSGLVVWRVVDSGTEEDNAANVEETDELMALPEDITTLMTFEEVEALATEEIGDAAIVDITVEQDEDVTVYQYRLEDGRILRFNAQNGTLISQSQGEQFSSGEPTFRNAGVTVGMEQAMMAAQNHYQNNYQNQAQNQNQNRIVRAGLGYEDGSLVFQFTFADGAEISVDAQTGEVIDAVSGTSDTDSGEAADDTSGNGAGSSTGASQGNN